MVPAWNSTRANMLTVRLPLSYSAMGKSWNAEVTVGILRLLVVSYFWYVEATAYELIIKASICCYYFHSKIALSSGFLSFTDVPL